MRPTTGWWFTALALATLGACTLFTSTDVHEGEEVLVLDVAPERVHCVGEMAGLCLQIRRPGEDEWRTFYGVIEGFQHEAGFRYRVRVARREVPDPPADASAYAYRLLEIISREQGL